MSDGWFIVGVFAAICIVIMGPITGLALWLASAACTSQATKMGLEYSWGPLQECMVNVDGKWMLLDSYKVVKIRPN